MVKKRMSKQNVVIIVLSVLLLLSLVFGATYAYFSGSSEQLTSGYITTAILNVELNPYDVSANQPLDSFELQVNDAETEKDETKNIVPGQPLSNTALQVCNKSPVATYMAVAYSLNILGNTTGEEIPDASKMEVMDLQTEAVGAGWRKHVYTCHDGATKISLLVYLGNTFAGEEVAVGYGDGICPASETEEGYSTLVLNADCLKVPTSWGNEMQGTTVEVKFTAYVVQVEALAEMYPDVTNENVTTRTNAIAEAVVSEFSLDKTIPSYN